MLIEKTMRLAVKPKGACTAPQIAYRMGLAIAGWAGYETCCDDAAFRAKGLAVDQNQP